MNNTMKKLSMLMKMARMLLVVAVLAIAGTAVAQTATSNETAVEAAETAVAVQGAGDFATAAKYFAIGLIMMGGSFAAALAVGKIGSAAMGAAAEKPELLGKAIAFVGLGEGIALFGFLISLFLLNK